MKRGFSILEILIVVAIIIIMVAVVATTFSGLSRTKAIDRDAELLSQILQQARSQTLASHNDESYGVHIGSNTITVFTGTSYNAAASTNEVYRFQTHNVVLTPTLTGGGSDIVFKRLTGETTQDGTITISSTATTRTKTVTIYKTGVIVSN